MLTVTYDRFGEPADVLRTAAVDSPTPGAGEVLLRMILSPIHHHDLWTIRGTYGVRPALPSGAGSEGVAVVEALGEGVEGLTVGDRVAAATREGTSTGRGTIRRWAPAGRARRPGRRHRTGRPHRHRRRGA